MDLGFFERSLARLNTAVSARLTNADAQLDFRPVRVLFDKAYVEDQGMASRNPVASLSEADAGDVRQGSWLNVEPIGMHRVTSVEPDGAGWVTLQLELQE